MVHSIFLYPVNGSMDVASVERFLVQQPDVVLDPLGSGTYIVCGVPAAKELVCAERRANPTEFPYAVLVTVKPEHVNVFQEYGDKAELLSARNIVQWIVDHQQCRVEDEYSRDWTERVAQQGADVLYPPETFR